jgi:hypothetical protein
MAILNDISLSLSEKTGRERDEVPHATPGSHAANATRAAGDAV